MRWSRISASVADRLAALVSLDGPGAPGGGVQGSLVIISASTGKTISSRPITAALSATVLFSPDGNYVFVTRDLEHLVAYPMWSATAANHVIPITGANEALVAATR